MAQTQIQKPITLEQLGTDATQADLTRFQEALGIAGEHRSPEEAYTYVFNGGNWRDRVDELLMQRREMQAKGGKPGA